ncbi:MAG: LysM peptidoglycan-binding domain-containing protein [Verrucomicrobia bacterium]|jgi:chromosome segregation ATPase|nr:LysM peptidoglycan-binding domain-containing protein [Verrucomicrobiota bacterium]
MRWNYIIYLFLFAIIGTGKTQFLMAQEQSVQSTIYLLRQESDERYRKLSAELEDAQQANLTLVRRLEALEEENRSLRNSINKLPADLVTESDAKKLSDALVEQIKSVDGKRAEDNKIISEEIKKIWKAIEELGKAPAPKEVKRATDKPRRVPKRIAEVVLEKGYTLSAIAEAYRLEGYDVTVDGILEANPNITDPTKIRAGDTIIVPIEW